jgi:hypothetical protein
MVFIEAKKRFTPTYNGPLTYNNTARDVTSCYTILKQNKLKIKITR